MFPSEPEMQLRTSYNFEIVLRVILLPIQYCINQKVNELEFSESLQYGDEQHNKTSNEATVLVK